MKTITEVRPVVGSNALGRTVRYNQQCFEIEQADVGREMPHYLGFNYRVQKIKHEDVGKRISRLSDGTGWTCWSYS